MNSNPPDCKSAPTKSHTCDSILDGEDAKLAEWRAKPGIMFGNSVQHLDFLAVHAIFVLQCVSPNPIAPRSRSVSNGAEG
jgi:hypothetical protein